MTLSKQESGTSHRSGPRLHYTAVVRIERLGSGDEKRLRSIRLRALHDSPDAFGTTGDEATALPPESWTEQLTILPTFIAVIDEEDVGIVRFCPDGKHPESGWLISMWVAPEIRRRGVGSRLIDTLTKFAFSAGFTRIELDVGDWNISAIALYASKGFEATGEKKAFDAPRNHIVEHRRVLKNPDKEPAADTSRR
jgi:ribosomal protein S18 acetylase RimI-like enzyme